MEKRTPYQDIIFIQLYISVWLKKKLWRGQKNMGDFFRCLHLYVHANVQDMSLNVCDYVSL